MVSKKKSLRWKALPIPLPPPQLPNYGADQLPTACTIVHRPQLAQDLAAVPWNAPAPDVPPRRLKPNFVSKEAFNEYKLERRKAQKRIHERQRDKRDRTGRSYPAAERAAAERSRVRAEKAAAEKTARQQAILDCRPAIDQCEAQERVCETCNCDYKLLAASSSRHPVMGDLMRVRGPDKRPTRALVLNVRMNKFKLRLLDFGDEFDAWHDVNTCGMCSCGM